MPKDSNKKDNVDELIISDDVVKPKKQGIKDAFFKMFGSKTTSNDRRKKRRPVIPLLIALVASLVLFIGLSFVSGWCAFGLLSSVGLFIAMINNNDYNNKQRMQEYIDKYPPLSNTIDTTPGNDLVIEGDMLNGHRMGDQRDNDQNINNENDIKQGATHDSNANDVHEPIFTQDNARLANAKNDSTNTNLDFLNNEKKKDNKIDM